MNILTLSMILDTLVADMYDNLSCPSTVEVLQYGSYARFGSYTPVKFDGERWLADREVMYVVRPDGEVKTGELYTRWKTNKKEWALARVKATYQECLNAGVHRSPKLDSLIRDAVDLNAKHTEIVSAQAFALLAHRRELHIPWSIEDLTLAALAHEVVTWWGSPEHQEECKQLFVKLARETTA